MLKTIGKLTLKEKGSVGGYMVKKMIEAQEGQMTSVYDGLEHGLNWSAPTMNY